MGEERPGWADHGGGGGGGEVGCREPERRRRLRPVVTEIGRAHV